MNTGVVILNYNTWQETLACAESVLASDEPPAWIVIVDNASTNDSLHWIRHWAKGNIDFVLPKLGARRIFPKPIAFMEFEERNFEDWNAGSLPRGTVVLLKRPKNGGYAAGNNAGIRLLLAQNADAVWILNNDTIVGKSALKTMSQRLFAKKRPGLCGSTVFYADSGLIQCRAGGYYDKFSGLSRLNGQGYAAAALSSTNAGEVEQEINFIYGASVMASRTFLREVGLLNESYFLYCEEQDWALRAAGNYDLAYAPEAFVWHKEGASTGFSHGKMKLRRMVNLARSRILLAARHTPVALPGVALGLAYAACRLIWRRLCRKRKIYM